MGDTPESGLLGISEVAKRLGVSVATVRHWDAKSYLRPSRRNPSGFRYYDPEKVEAFRLELVAAGENPPIEAS